MLFSARLKQILRQLLELPDNQYIKVDELATSIKVSRRTIFRELEGVNASLLSSGLTLESRSGKGLRIIGNQKDRQTLLENLDSSSIPYHNKEERQKLLLYQLLANDSPQKLIFYANRFQVSEATISKDLETISKAIQPYGLEVEKGGRITGAESTKRQLMTSLLRSSLSDENINYYNNPALLKDVFLLGDPNSIMHLLDQQILDQVLGLFTLYQHELNLDRYEQSSYIGLIIHLVIAIARIRKGESISQNVPLNHVGAESLQTAKTLADVIGREFDITFPQAEISYIALHLQGAKITNVQNNTVKADAFVKKLAMDFIHAFDGAQAAILANDSQFLQGLITHLEPTITRLQSGLPIYNPLLSQLKAQYKDLFDQTRKAALSLEQAIDKPISDAEVGYLTMHVGASLERMRWKQPSRPLKAGVICASGIGVSALLAARLQAQFPQSLQVKTLSVAQASQPRDLDLLISTIPNVQSPIPLVQVSSLLSEQDLANIERMMEQIPRNEKKESQNDFNDSMEAIAQASKAAKEVIDNLQILRTDSLQDPMLIHQASEAAIGDTTQIEEDLKRREALGVVIDWQEGYRLFHAITNGVDRLQYLLMVSNAATGIRLYIVCLLPEHYNPQQQKLLSMLNESLVLDPGFLSVLKSGQRPAIEEALMKKTRAYVSELALSSK